MNAQTTSLFQNLRLLFSRGQRPLRFTGLLTGLCLAPGLLAKADGGSARASAATASVPQEVVQVGQWLSGTFDSSLQASQDPDYFNVRLTSCQVTLLGSDGQNLSDAVYLYVEQAIAGREQSPYRQRIYRIADARGKETDSPVVESEILLLSDPRGFVGLCSQDTSKRVIQRSNAENRGCSVFLRPTSSTSEGQAETRFEGTTPPGGCPSSFNGATTVTSYVSLGAASLIAWDIGRDAQGDQVWGPEKGPYVFRRTSTPLEP